MAKTLFISDLHLSETHSHITKLFSQFLESETKNIDALYILGDLFETWIGDDDNSSFHQLCIQAIKKVTDAGVSIYFICGNRDFLVGKRFAKATGCTILKEPYIFDLYGTKTLLMHGDTLCTDDTSYLRFRKIIRSWPIRLILKNIPLAWRRKLAAKARKNSNQHMQKLSHEIMDTTPSEIHRIINENEVDLLIHGHTHQPSISLYYQNNKITQRIVLSDWHKQGNYLVYTNSGNKNLLYF